MKNRLRFLLPIASAMCLCGNAHADYIIAGAQYLCDPKQGLFDIRPYERTSQGNSEIQPGYKKLPDGPSTIICQLKHQRILIDLLVIPPQDRGMCMGGGDVTIDPIKINGTILLGRTDFDFVCPMSPTVVSISITEKDQHIELQKCVASDDSVWDPVTSPTSCETKTPEPNR